MQAINFHYWLQGCFELGLINSLDANQLEILKQHISLVKNKSEFILWLEGFLTKKNSLNEELCLVLVEKLQKEFDKVPMENTPINPFPLGFPEFDLKRFMDREQIPLIDTSKRLIAVC